jgi:hypothetical protein
MQNYQEKYEALLKEFEQYKKESIKWSAEDFYYLAEDMGYQITWEQCQEALEDMIKQIMEIKIEGGKSKAFGRRKNLKKRKTKKKKLNTKGRKSRRHY